MMTAALVLCCCLALDAPVGTPPPREHGHASVDHATPTPREHDPANQDRGTPPRQSPSQSRQQRVDLAHGSFWLSLPPDLDAEARYPLIVCLRGTGDHATDMLAFWRTLDLDGGGKRRVEPALQSASMPPLPCIIVAPEAVGEGWCDLDLPFLVELRAYVEANLPYDPQRVLLTGHSAGGAMTFQLAYVEGFPATAIAVTANYLPPTVITEHVRVRADLPVFYAVGEADLNQPRMREGLHLLRRAGARVTVERPPIGHVLNLEVGRHAMDWFMAHCRRGVDDRLARARDSLREASLPGPPAADLESIIRQRASHDPDQVAEVAELLQTLQQPGLTAMANAERLADGGDPLAAREALLAVALRYRPSFLAGEADARRARIEAHPVVAAHLAAAERENRERRAADLWQASLQALSQSRLDEARRNCRNILALYPDSTAAARARQLLDQIDSAGTQ